LYSHGSYGAGTLRPGRSDVDLVAVVEDLEPELEVDVLVAIGRRYRPRQAILPIDLSVVSRSEFVRAAGWVAHRRRLIGADKPVAAVAAWRLLGGEELREAKPWEPDRRLGYVSEAQLSEALTSWAVSPKEFALKLGRFATLVERESLDWPGARRLVAAAPELARLGGAREGFLGALEIMDADRARHEIPRRRKPASEGWRLAQPDPEKVETARALISLLEPPSATLYLEPARLSPTLLVDAGPPDRAERVVDWALRTGARAAHAAGMTLEITTSRMAEDSWRPGFRWIGLVGASEHVAGTPFLPRFRLPEQEFVDELLDFRAFSAGEVARSSLLGLRTMRSGPWVLRQLALVRDLLAGEALVAPSTHSESLDERELTKRAVELRRECSTLLDAKR